MIADMVSNKKLNQIVTELFIRAIRLNMFLSLNLILHAKRCYIKYYTFFYYENSK